MSREIIININEANKAQKYKNKNELFQIEAFERVTEILKEHLHGDDVENIVDCRFHDTIFIDGDRGVGKTAFMLNIEKFYNKFADEKENQIDEDYKNKQEYSNERKNTYIFLNPIDPTLLEHTEKFLSVVLARIVEKVNDSIETNKINEKYLDNYYESLEKLSKSLSAIKTLDNDLGIEEIASSKSSLKLEQHSHKFFKAVCNLFYNSHALVMLIDDVDMAFDKGFDVLEVVRKYLASPYIIPVVAGDMKLYKAIIKKSFIKKLNDDAENKILIDNLTQQYVHKIFPHEYFIQLNSIYSIIKNSKLVQIDLYNDDKKLIDLDELMEYESTFINKGINQDNFKYDVFIDNTRDFINYIFTKKEIFQDNFSDKIIDNQLSMKLTASFYKYSNNTKKQELSLLAYNDSISFIDNKYNIYTAFTNDFFINSKLSTEIRENNLSIEYKNYNEIQTTYNEIEKYIIDLFVFSDYFTQHQTKKYLFSGKFIEMMIYSISIEETIDFDDIKSKLIDNLINNINLENLLEDEGYQIYSILYDKTNDDVDKKDIDNLELSSFFNSYENKIDNNNLSDIANKIPFNSEFLYNKRFIDDKEMEEEDDLFIEYRIDDLNRELIIWKNLFCKDIKLNSLSLYEILHKFFNNFNIVKHSNLNDSPLEFMKRTVIIFINAISYFENNDLTVANTNIAIKKDFDLNNILTKTNASLKNIKPMLKVKGSLTRALFFHPIISHILFPHEDSQLEEVIFTNSYSTKVEKYLNSITIYKNASSFSTGQRTRILRSIINNDKLVKDDIILFYKISRFKDNVIDKKVNKDAKGSDALQTLIDNFLDKLNAK